MAIYDEVKGNIVRQELQLIEAGQHYKSYSAKVKYSPENIEKGDFFRLCYGMLTKCDEINLYTFKKDTYEVCYKFVVTEASIENKSVNVRLLSKIDFATEATENADEKEFTLADVQKLIKKEIKALSEVVAVIDTKVESLTESTTQYQEATDDQLEAIENKLEVLETAEPTEESVGEATQEVDQTKGTTKV